MRAIIFGSLRLTSIFRDRLTLRLHLVDDYHALQGPFDGILLHGEPVDAFSTIVHRSKSYAYGKQMTERLKELIPRQLFDVAVQASASARRERGEQVPGLVAVLRRV